MTLEQMTPRRQRPRRHRATASAAAALLMISLGLGGCSLLPGSGNTPNPITPASTSAAPVPTQSQADAPPAETQAPPAKTAAEELQDKLKASLGSLAATTKAPNRGQMMDAMLAAGAVQEKVEVSIDVTPTGLAVDAIEAAALVADQCVVGQVRDGNVAVTILPVLKSGRCFVGDVH